jgi:3-phosphoglycerate kinase
VVAHDITARAATQVADTLEAGWKGGDIGPRTRELYAERLQSART